MTASAAIAQPKWKQLFFHPKPKPKLTKSNELVWPIKHNKLNKYIYKHKTKLLTCKVRLELASEHSSSSDLKLTLQLHPCGTEEDCNKSITAKVSIELAKKYHLHSKTSIKFQISATASGNQDNPSSEIEIGRLQQQYVQITQNFFYIINFIIHEELKKSQCNYVQVIASAKLHT